jgi:PIF1-like helicase
LIAAAAVIVWEELPSANVAAVQCAHNICCAITKVFRPFGGIPFIGVGDFRQVAPVVQGQGIAPVILASIKSSSLWAKFRILSLDIPIRSESDLEFTEFVDRIGEDWRSEFVSLSLLDSVSDIEEATDFLYPPHILSDPFKCIRRAFLSPMNTYVDNFNGSILDRVPGDECLRVSVLTV